MMFSIPQPDSWPQFLVSYLAVAALFALTGYCVGRWLMQR